MSADDDPQQSPTARTRKRLIDESLARLYQARAACQRSRIGYGEVDETLRADLQQAILDLYWALRPLRNEDPVDEWWGDVELSEQWTERVADVDGELHRPGIEVDVEEVPKTGLETLQVLDGMTRTETKTTETFRGTTTETIVEPTILSYDVLVDISGVLEDAAGKLGFNPSTPEGASRTEITDELIEEVRQWRQKNV